MQEVTNNQVSEPPELITLPINEVPKLPLSSVQQKEIQELKRQMQEMGISTANIQFPKPGFYHDIIEVIPYISSITLTNSEISEEKAAIAALRQSDPTNFQENAANLLDLSDSYYKAVLKQSKQSFVWALIASGIGLFCFLVAVFFLLIHLGDISYYSATISAVGGALVEVIAGLILVQSKQKSEQATDYHIRLDRIQRFIVANSACEGLEGEIKQTTRAELIRALADLSQAVSKYQKQ